MSCADKVKVACVGNSITYGYGLPQEQAYPSILEKKLGKGYKVKNFGHSGATALKKSDLPYWSVPEFKKVKRFQPDIIVLLLGTNDVKNYQWPGQSVFTEDYANLVSKLSSLESGPEIYICTPPPVFLDNDFISNETIKTEVIPAITGISREKNLPLIDFNLVFEGKSEHFPDSVHPNEAATKIMANHVYEKILKALPSP